jgi:uncharacterized protein
MGRKRWCFDDFFRFLMQFYRAPAWLPGGHAQTIWPALFAQRFTGAAPRLARERWITPDADFIDVDRLVNSSSSPKQLVLFHGLEGSSGSHYAQAFAHWALMHGWQLVVPHFRGCSGELNWGPRAYHSGDFEEIGWVLARLRAEHTGAMVAVGISLGGNALLRWVQEAGETAARSVSAVCAVSAPLDLTASGHAIGRGFNLQVYTRLFLRTMKPKALRKLAQHPGLFDREKMLNSRNLYEFDNVFSAPLHGFRDTDDYWLRASAKPHLHRIRLPTLIINARNDPFLPAKNLPSSQQTAACVTLWQPTHGGHVGFPGGHWPGHVHTLPERVMAWMSLYI